MKRKLVITVMVLLTLSLLAGYDVYRSGQFHIELVAMDPKEAPADGQSPVRLQLRLTDSKGRPVEGHSLYALPRGGGIMSASRTLTDAEGEAVYTYYPYKASALQPAKDIEVRIIDESNSIFFEINASTTVTIPLYKPDKEVKSNHNLNDIFGE
ncbi:Ig-like domain-containing protein [Paenibacillus sp. GCM10027626]|uniref:Ig-like domain-containing protein n=1 Tax=Paenibacillus sp. GCM10027626 TaxID=3273411 RepID=UPI00362B381D